MEPRAESRDAWSDFFIPGNTQVLGPDVGPLLDVKQETMDDRDSTSARSDDWIAIQPGVGLAVGEKVENVPLSIPAPENLLDFTLRDADGKELDFGGVATSTSATDDPFMCLDYISDIEPEESEDLDGPGGDEDGHDPADPTLDDAGDGLRHVTKASPASDDVGAGGKTTEPSSTGTQSAEEQVRVRRKAGQSGKRKGDRRRNACLYCGCQGLAPSLLHGKQGGDTNDVNMTSSADDASARPPPWHQHGEEAAAPVMVAPHQAKRHCGRRAATAVGGLQSDGRRGTQRRAQWQRLASSLLHGKQGGDNISPDMTSSSDDDSARPPPCRDQHGENDLHHRTPLLGSARDHRRDSMSPSQHSPPASDAGSDVPAVISDEISLQGPVHGGMQRLQNVYYTPCPKEKVYDTVNVCLFCEKKIKQKMKRHLVVRHKTEERVLEALSHAPEEQQRCFKKLLCEGNFAWNIKVLNRGQGELMLMRRPKTANIPIASFLPCPGCQGFMLKADLENHRVHCPDVSASWMSSNKVRPETVVGGFDDERSPRSVANMEDDAESDEPPAAISEEISLQGPLHGGMQRLQNVYYTPCPKEKVYDTVNVCLFCEKKIKQKMKRHLVIRHKTEESVLEALSHAPEEQQRCFKKLLCKGNFAWNIKVLNRGQGELMLMRRPKTANIPIASFLPCPGCQGFMLKADLENHCVHCPDVSASCMSSIKVRAETLVGGFDNDQSPRSVANMKDDILREVVSGDSVLMGYATYSEDSKGTSKVQEKTLLFCLNKLAQLLLAVRETTGKADLDMQAMCTPVMFDDVVAVTKKMGGYEAGPEVPSFSVPSTPRVVRRALGKVVHFLRGRAIRNQDEESEQAVDLFSRLLSAEWGDRISRASPQT